MGRIDDVEIPQRLKLVNLVQCLIEYSALAPHVVFLVMFAHLSACEGLLEFFAKSHVGVAHVALAQQLNIRYSVGVGVLGDVGDLKSQRLT